MSRILEGATPDASAVQQPIADLERKYGLHECLNPLLDLDLSCELPAITVFCNPESNFSRILFNFRSKLLG